MIRTGRRADQMRELALRTDVVKNSLGSVLVAFGNTEVICTANVEEKVPPFLRDSNRGWITAEYGMLPGSTPTRKERSERRGKVDGRTVEIQRLIGRSIRAVADLEKLTGRTLWLDCDVIQADGGTRSAAVTGAFVAAYQAIQALKKQKLLLEDVFLDTVAAVSVGMVEGKSLLDLDYLEDSNAEVDMNIVMTGSGKLVEIQGTAERSPFEEENLLCLLKLARKGIRKLTTLQRRAIRWRRR